MEIYQGDVPAIVGDFRAKFQAFHCDVPARLGDFLVTLRRHQRRSGDLQVVTFRDIQAHSGKRGRGPVVKRW